MISRTIMNVPKEYRKNYKQIALDLLGMIGVTIAGIAVFLLLFACFA